MLEATFQLVSGIDEKVESRLWKSGITRWGDLLELNSHPHIARNHLKKLKAEIREYQSALENKRFDQLLARMPRKLIWRLFPNLREDILYFDVEATGLDKDKDSITTIATYNGKEIKLFVAGENLNQFPEYADNYSAIATFDGARLDIPLINRQLNYFFSQIHFDLFYISRSLRVYGGLKKIERRIGVDRDPLIQEIDGTFAIFLWKEYQETRDPKFLETLLSYNIEDVIHLEEMLYIFYNELRKKYGLPVARLRYKKTKPVNPKSIDSSAIHTINEKYFVNEETQ